MLDLTQKELTAIMGKPVENNQWVFDIDNQIYVDELTYYRVQAINSQEKQAQNAANATMASWLQPILIAYAAKVHKQGMWHLTPDAQQELINWIETR